MLENHSTSGMSSKSSDNFPTKYSKHYNFKRSLETVTQILSSIIMSVVDIKATVSGKTKLNKTHHEVTTSKIQFTV